MLIRSLNDDVVEVANGSFRGWYIRVVLLFIYRYMAGVQATQCIELYHTPYGYDC